MVRVGAPDPGAIGRDAARTLPVNPRGAAMAPENDLLCLVAHETSLAHTGGDVNKKA
jgi:hypothetical protein